MNLKELLASKQKRVETPKSYSLLTEVEYTPVNMDSQLLFNRPEFIYIEDRTGHEALKSFLILFYRSNRVDTSINYGEGAKTLYYILGCPLVLSSDYPPIPFGHSISDSYVLVNTLGIPENAIYYTLKEIQDEIY